MKILITFYGIDDMGGIINHHENLVAGFRELGHQVQTKLLVWKDQAPRSMAGGHGTFQHSGLEHDQRRGYSWKQEDIIPYKGSANLSKWRDYAAQFDLIIWQVAVPTKRSENRGNTDWLYLYDVPVHQIAVIHDGNFLDSYPWLYAVARHLNGLACVHHCAFNSARYINIPSALIFNPQEITGAPDLSRSAWERREKGFLSLQTFKAWKHVPELVAAAPYAPNTKRILAGKGIDYYYLTSKDKCKYPGIWDAAIVSGMEYRGVITNEERDKILQGVACLVDPSWSRKYSAIGGHFNRVLIDGIKMGALPIVRPWGISTNFEGIGELFRDGENCIAIPQHFNDQDYGLMLEWACDSPYESYRAIMDEAVLLLPKFERKAIARQFLNLAEGAQVEQVGSTSVNVYEKGAKVLTEFFNERS